MDGMAVGIVGAGWMAREHRRVLESLGDVSIAAVCDVDRERAEELASGTGARVYVDWRDLLDREDLAALAVCIPPLAHREPTVEALTRGLPVYLEKPIARTLPDAAAIVEVAERTGTVCAVGYQWHALDLLGDLRQLLEGEQVGLLVGTSIGPTQSRPWFLDRRAGGGNLLERGSHHLDLARAVGGDVASVQAAASGVRLARSASPGGRPPGSPCSASPGGRPPGSPRSASPGSGADGGDIDDAVTITLKLASGALATVLVAWTRPGQPGSYALDVVASDSTLRLNLDPDFTLTGMSHDRPVSRKSASHPLERSWRRFLHAAAQRDPSAVVCPPPDAAATLAVAAAAEQALETGQAVPVATL
jgi:myo-inositol 2-dehydrogenase / D-chiro-inositol 1-dehydrogenase